MLLQNEKSRCKKDQKIIVSRDERVKREHRATNSHGKYEVRQYKLDGELVKNKKCCDFLLLNDSLKKAYFIELKGSNIDEAIPQLESAEVMFRAELSGYIILYRIVCSKVRAHKVNSNNFRKFRAKVGNALEYKSVWDLSRNETKWQKYSK